MGRNKGKLKMVSNGSIAVSAIIGHKSLRKGVKRRKVIIGKNPVVLSGSVIYEGVKLGDNVSLGHNVIIRENNSVGNNSKIWSNSIIDYGCNIGNNVKIHSNVYLAQFTEIEDDAFIGPGTITANDLHPGCKFSKKCLRGPLIKKGAKIGANVTLNPHIVIGENALIGSGSVVTKDVPENCVAYGNPAEVKTKITELKCTKGITRFPYKIRQNKIMTYGR